MCIVSNRKNKLKYPMRHWIKSTLALFILPATLMNRTRSLPGRASFQLTDNMSDLEQKRKYPILWFEEVGSTMDKTRELLKRNELASAPIFAVLAEHQTNGRGTRGRDWKWGQNNMFLTISLKRSAIGIPITLLPLRIGTIIASSVIKYVDPDRDSVKLKWPNDILIGNRKVCGILIEMEGDHLLIGIGCNVMSAPSVNSDSADADKAVRGSTCFAEHNSELADIARQLHEQADRERESRGDKMHNSNEVEILSSSTGVDSSRVGGTVSGTVFHSFGDVYSSTINSDTAAATVELSPYLQTTLKEGDFHKQFAIQLCNQVDDWIQSQTDTAELVLQDFSANMDYSPQRLRDAPNEVVGTVVPLRLNADGTLQVKYIHSGEEGVLVAEYLW